jgi:CPA1 family monovalent cation:H+ antiporter
MDQEAFVTTVMAVVSLLFVAALSALLMKRIRFPYTVGLVIVGVGIAFLADDHPELGEALDNLKLETAMIMFLFVPILIFESAFKMDVRLLVRNLLPAFVLAGPGLLISTALIGWLVHVFTQLPLGSALVFGCLISATDPVAVIALFRDVGAPKRLNILVEGESVFNDATAIVSFQIILAVMATGILDTRTVLEGVGGFFAVFLGGLAVGLAFGYTMVRAIPYIGDEPLIHITLTLTTAYGAFIVADHFLHASGIMAVLGAGLTIGYYGPGRFKQRVKDYLEIFWEDAAFVANSLIFLMLGLSEKVFLTHTHANVSGLLVPVLIVILIVVMVRSAVVFGLAPLLNAVPGASAIPRTYQTVMFWGGLRGAVAIALAMSLPPHFPFRWQIIDFTFGVTLFTLLFNGTTMGWLIRRLGLDKPSPVLEFMGAYANAAADRAALERLNAYRPVSNVSTQALARLKDDYASRTKEADLRLDRLRQELGGHRSQRRRLLWLRAFAVQRKVYRERFDNGILGLESLHELEWNSENARFHPDTGVPIRSDDRLLPADKTSGVLRRFAREVLPGVPPVRRWLEHRMLLVAEEAAAVAAASREVRGELAQLQEFSLADEEDLNACAAYFDELESLASARLAYIETQYPRAGDVLYGRLLNKMAFDKERDVIKQLALEGEIPEILAERIEHEMGEDGEGDRKSR